jgi:hypothetical protein
MASRGLTTLFDQATTFGIAMSFFSLTLGGVTMVWERLSASGGTEMTAWRAGAGSAWSAGSVEALRVSRGGRYSDGW